MWDGVRLTRDGVAMQASKAQKRQPIHVKDPAPGAGAGP